MKTDWDFSRGPPPKARAYAELKRLILAGECAPGDFITVRQMADHLNMSATPVRAAFEQLASEGLVRIGPLGTRIPNLSVHEIADQYEIRAALETYVVRTLAGHLRPDQVVRLQENLAAQKALDGDVPRWVALDTEFHTLFCHFLGNREILRVMGQLRDKMHRVITKVFQTNPGRLAGSYLEHCGIAEAVINGDGPLAAKRAEQHLEYGKQLLLSPRRG